MKLEPVLDLLGEVSYKIGRDKVEIILSDILMYEYGNDSYHRLYRAKNYAPSRANTVLDEMFEVFNIPEEYSSVIVFISW